MEVIFAERAPTPEEVERFRLILSTFQDGSGMQAVKEEKAWMRGRHVFTLPGWRDFERAVALAFNGRAVESKWIYDVVISHPERPNVQYGLSCKMRGELRRVHKGDGRVTIELSNAAGGFWDTIKAKTGLTEDSYTENPLATGVAVIELVESWHRRVSIGEAGRVDSSKSFFLTLQWNNTLGEYQLFQFPIDLPSPAKLSWSVEGRKLVGNDRDGTIFEWYGHSGGQLKYYPPAQESVWHSEVFGLEPLPEDLTHITLDKAAAYFREQWDKLAILDRNISI